MATLPYESVNDGSRCMECFLLVSLCLQPALERSDTIDASCIFAVKLMGRVYQNIKYDKGLIYDEIQEPSLGEISICSLSDSETCYMEEALNIREGS